MSVFRIVRTLDGVKSYLIEEDPYDLGTWTRKKSRATLYDTAAYAEEHLRRLLGVAIPPISENLDLARYCHENLYYDRPYYNYRLWRFMFGMHGERTTSNATFAVVGYYNESDPGKKVSIFATEPQDMAKHTPLRKSQFRYFFFNEVVASAADEDAAVAATLTHKYQHLEAQLDINRRLIAGSRRNVAMSNTPLRYNTAYAEYLGLLISSIRSIRR